MSQTLSETPAQGNPTTSKPTIYRFADLLDDLALDVKRKHDAREAGRPLGCGTGFPGLDAALGEYLENGLHLIQGAPGAGKSAFGLQMAGHSGFPALYISTEMPVLELFRRTIARETRTYLGKLKSGELGPKEAERLAMEAARRVPNVALVDAVRNYASREYIIEEAVALREACGAESVLVVMDSAQGWIRQRMSALRREEYAETNAAIIDLCEIAATLKCPVVTINHRNRAGNKENGGMHAAKGSGDWEYFIESGIDLTPENNGQADVDGYISITANIWKNRNGVPNVSKHFRFNGGFQEFTESEGRAASGTSSRNGGGRKLTKREQVKAELDEYESFMG